MDLLQKHSNHVAMGETRIAIVSDDPEFVRVLTGCWQSQRVPPAFVVFSGDSAARSFSECDLVVAGGLSQDRFVQLLHRLDQSLRSIICVAGEGQYGDLREMFPSLLLMRRDESWADNVLLLAGECLRRRQAVARGQRAEQSALTSHRHAGLGKYMVEMRHDINNALTSVLGNAELLLLSLEEFSPETREQLETIRGMSLRMHEIMQRFWSLEAEMKVAERRSCEPDTGVKGMAASSS